MRLVADGQDYGLSAASNVARFCRKLEGSPVYDALALDLDETRIFLADAGSTIAIAPARILHRDLSGGVFDDVTAALAAAVGKLDQFLTAAHTNPPRGRIVTKPQFPQSLIQLAKHRKARRLRARGQRQDERPGANKGYAFRQFSRPELRHVNLPSCFPLYSKPHTQSNSPYGIAFPGGTAPSQRDGEKT